MEVTGCRAMLSARLSIALRLIKDDLSPSALCSKAAGPTPGRLLYACVMDGSIPVYAAEGSEQLVGALQA